MILDRKKAVYLLGNMRLKGYVTDAGDGLYWFNTTEREERGKEELLVPASHLKILV